MLIETFNGKIPLTTSKEQKLCWLCEFSESWDFRARQKEALDSKTGERARWMIDNEGLNEEQKSAAMAAARSLGLVDFVQPRELRSGQLAADELKNTEGACKWF